MQKKIFSIVLILTIIASMIFPVYAEDLSVTYTLDKSTVTAKPGSIVQVLLGVADIDSNTTGINAITGFVSYDEDLIENIEMIGAGNNWSVQYNKIPESEKNGTFAASNLNAIKDSQAVVKLMITLKSDATVKTGKVTLEDLKTSYGSTGTEPQTKVITINVEDDDQGGNGGNIEPANPGTDPATPEPSEEKPAETPAPQTTPAETQASPTKTTNDKSKTTSTTTTSKATSLPKAGIIASGIGIAILAAIIVAIIELIKYKKITK